MQSNAYDNSVRRAPNSCSLSMASLNFSIISRRHCWALFPFRKPHWLRERMLSKYTSEMFVNTPTGRSFSLKPLSFLLCTGITSSCFQFIWKSPSSIQWLKLLLINFSKISLLSLMILVGARLLYIKRIW